MWFIISLIFAFAALFSGNIQFWIIFALMVVAHNIEHLAIQIKKLHSDEEQPNT